MTATIIALTAGLAHAGLTFTTIHTFNDSDGNTPMGELVQGRDGSLYGLTQYGGPSEAGTVFKISMDGTFTSLAVFSKTNGDKTHAGLVLGADGDFYGTTWYGGATDQGTVFKVTPSGTLTLLVSFNGLNGAYPGGELVQASDGNFYGTTIAGGLHGGQFNQEYGTIFRMTLSGEITTLVFFNDSIGFDSWSALTKGQYGSFYGTTRQGGVYTNEYGPGPGTIFKIDLNGTFTNLQSFDLTNGAGSLHPLVRGTDGNLYGTSWAGTNLDSSGNGLGNVFRVTPGGELKSIFSFNGTNGYLPRGLALARDGNFYGLTAYGGSTYNPNVSYSGQGTIFKITPEGALTTLIEFTNHEYAFGGLVHASDGNLYGTTRNGGSSWAGTIFRLSVPMPPVLQAVAPTTGAFAVTWIAVSGQSYQVQRSTNVATASWENLGSAVTATNGIMTVMDSGGAVQQHFYRVALLP
jgi:uncharacterized repeat protein (TIGR03803 family)